MTVNERFPQQERSLARRSAILHAAAVTFDRVGFSAASLSYIASEAGVGAGSIYFYFQTKEAIALAVIDEQNARTFANLTDEEQPVSPIESLISASKAIAALLLSDPMVRAGIRLSLEQGVFAEPTVEYYEQWIGGVIDSFAAARDAYEITDVISPHALGETVVSYFTGVQLVSDVRSGRGNLMNVVGTMWTLITYAVVQEDHRDRILNHIEGTFGI